MFLSKLNNINTEIVEIHLEDDTGLNMHYEIQSVELITQTVN